jgi:chorismate mutase/prephenate dehydratase
MDRLKFYRKRLNTLDREIAVNIARKIDLVKEVWSWKKANNIPLIDKKREKEIIEKNSEISGLDKKFLKKIYEEARKEIRRQFKE